MAFTDKHIFFDLDRTLWDFDKNSEAALYEIFLNEKLNEKINFHEFHETYIEINAALWRLYSLGELKKDVLRDLRFEKTLEKFGMYDHDLANRFGTAYVEISPKKTALFPGAIDTLKELKNIGFNLHIITNGFQEVQFIKLSRSGLEPYFDVIVCSEFVGKNKPDPEIFQYALFHAKTTVDKALMIGDDFHADIIGASQIGMKSIYFNPTGETKNHHSVTIRSLDEIPFLAIKLFS